jgi:hypothetical protein
MRAADNPHKKAVTGATAGECEVDIILCDRFAKLLFKSESPDTNPFAFR